MLVTCCGVFRTKKKRKRRKKVGKLSRVNLQVLSWKLLICGTLFAFKSSSASASLVISATLTPEWTDHVTCDIPELPHRTDQHPTIKQPHQQIICRPRAVCSNCIFNFDDLGGSSGLVSGTMELGYCFSQGSRHAAQYPWLSIPIRIESSHLIPRRRPQDVYPATSPSRHCTNQILDHDHKPQ